MSTKSQAVFVEFHLLQNFAPSLLNRDDTGAHKDAIFGGVRRARISSQCLKRAIRTYWANTHAIADDARAVRTQRILNTLADALAARGRNADAATQRAQAALGALKLQADDDGKSQYLLFLGADEVAKLAGVVDQYWDELEPASSDGGEAGKKVSAKARKQAAKDAVSKEVVNAMEAALSDTRSLEVRLFGRMLADLPGFNSDANCQVAHALGTSALEREFDFFTAVDDLKPDSEDAGAGMIGQVEFASACFYRYASLNVHGLHRDLGSDIQITRRSLELFADAMVHALPTGKQNTFAAHQKPSHVAITVSTQPRSLANAFEKPMNAKRSNLSLSGLSAKALEEHRQKLDTSYGSAGTHRFHDLSDAGLGGAANVAELIQSAVDDVIARLA